MAPFVEIATASTAFRVDKTAEPATYRASGELDLFGGTVLSSAVEPAVANGAGDITLDLTNLIFIDVRGVACLVAIADSLQDGRRLVLDGVSGFCERVLDLLRVRERDNIIVLPHKAA